MIRREYRPRVSPLVLVAALCAVVASGQVLKPKEKLEDYPAHAALKDGYSMGAEYLLHTLPTRTRSGQQDALVANDYLVVEVAVFGPKKSTIDVLAGKFELYLNHKEMPITPDSPGTVAGSIKYSDWTQKPRVELSAGSGNASINVGPTRTPRFPGDPSAGNPRPSPVPEQNPAGLEKSSPLTIDEMVEASALHSGELAPPVAGLIYFPFPGKTKSIKALELVYEGPLGRVALKIQ